MLALIVFGGVAWNRLGVSQFPDVDLPTVNVRLSLPGAAPEVIESDVVDIVESALVQVEGITSMSSTCRQGTATIRLELQLHRNVDAAIQEVQTRLAQVQTKLPRDMDPPEVSKQNPEDQPILWVSAYGTKAPQEISDYVDHVLRDQFQVIPGVGDITMGGFRARNIRVWVDTRQLNAYRLTIDEVLAALSREHIELPSGRIESSHRELNVRTEGEAIDLKDFQDIVIAERGKAVIHLRDVAIVENGQEDKRRIARFNGMPAVGLGIRKLRGANAVEVAHAVKARLADLHKTLPPGIQMSVVFDSTQFVEDAINEIVVTLILAVLLTGVVCWAFLGSWSSTLNVLLAIPTSLVGTMAVMYFLGFTINTFTLLALSLAVGIVVDDAIMVLENIFRHAEMGKDRVQASLHGAEEITFAAIVATLSITAIFLPIAFVKGIIGKFLYQFGVVLSVAVALSLVEALTITPARTSQFLTVHTRTGWIHQLVERLFHRWTVSYKKWLGPTLRHRYWVLGGAVGLFLLTLPLIGWLGSRWEMVPAQDQSRFQMRMIAPVGSSIDYTDERVRKVEEFLSNRPEVDLAFVSVGGFGGGEVDSANATVTLKPVKQRKLSQKEFMNLARRELNKIPGLTTLPSDPSTNLPGVGGRGQAQVNCYIRGDEWEVLTGASQKMVERMQASPILRDVNSDYRIGAPEVGVRPDRKKAADLGISMEAIGSSINALIGGVRVAKFKDEGRRYDVRVRLRADQRLKPEDIDRLYVKTKSGTLVNLANVVDVSTHPSLLTITRENRSRAINFQCNPGEGYSSTQAVGEVSRIAKEVLPPGYFMELTGASKTSKETLNSLWFALGFGIVVAYMILAAQFNSFIHPVTVLMALPFSLTGAMLGLWMTGYSLNMFSMIGVVLLMGIVKKNSILLVDFTNQRREAGDGVQEALMTACPTRLRPILMTTIATIAGAAPAAFALNFGWLGLGHGGGSELRAPMAVAVIGGLIVSTFLTLFVVPAVYASFEDLKGWLAVKWAARASLRPETRPASVGES